ncbi:MAG: branched-chain amino acid ABC transporter permease [Rhodospirillaceae bacterium]|mgnify:FL=1|jgi:branched-chain amino acid transport system permease protein|nr:branched-chain amino acid ABC transporter permease [Rhodospirillaceae bacterium]MBT7956583.1 branched-chain amino acid ABC transporter permease [Rhodospirillaceae bacterium]
MNNSLRLIGTAAVIVILASLSGLASEYMLGIGFTLFMYIALAQSWIILSGMTGYISLGHVVFFGSGAYVFVLLWGLVPVWLGVAISGLVVGIGALMIGYPVLRVRGPYFVILSFGLAELVKNLVLINEARMYMSLRPVFGAPPLAQLYIAMLVLAVVATALTYWIRRSRFGAGLRSIREDEWAAETIGVPASRLKLIAFALSGLIPAMVGAIFIMRSGIFQPGDAFNPIVSFTIVTMAIIGGSDDAAGPLLGVAFLVILQELLWANWPEIYMIILGVLLIGFVLFAPGGILGWCSKNLSRSKKNAA